MISSSGPFELAHNIGPRGGYLGTLGASSGVRTSTLELPMQIHVEDPSEAARGTYASGNEIEDEIARLRRENELLKQSLMQTKQKQQAPLVKRVPQTMAPQRSSELSSGNIMARTTSNAFEQNLFSSQQKQGGYDERSQKPSYEVDNTRSPILYQNNDSGSGQVEDQTRLRAQVFTVSPIREEPGMSFSNRDGSDPSSMIMINGPSSHYADPASATAGFNKRHHRSFASQPEEQPNYEGDYSPMTLYME
jgi:hypothetical protein